LNLLRRKHTQLRSVRRRRGAVAVEAALVLPMVLVLLFGIWEVGRFVLVGQVLNTAAREGARLAAGGYTINNTPVTCAMVQQAVQDYLTAAGFPSAAVTGSQVSVVCQAATSWTDPYQAQPLDKFQVVVTIPSGAAFNSLRWTLLPRLTSITQLTITVTWYSLNNSQCVVSTALPY
jgi:Flp pilus assembly protein TadG